MSNIPLRSWPDPNRQGPVTFGLSVILIVFALLVVILILGYFLGWGVSAADVTKKEFGPDAALAKYEWFINQANLIGKADKDIELFEQKRVEVESRYNTTYGADRSKWLPSAQAQYNQDAKTARDDLIAVVSNRNKLVEEYNAQSEKFNWALFQTRPDLPKRTYFSYTVK